MAIQIPSVNSVKDQLLEELWIAFVRRSGSLFYPRLRKKRMKIFTLTSDTNFLEIPKFVESKLTNKKNILAWNYSHIKVWRLETEPQISPAIVLGATRFEDSILSNNHPLINYFPFDVLNLDFSSQEPGSHEGRMEKEIQSLERTIEIQKRVGVQLGGFALIYTTLLNSREINCHTIIQRSDDMRFQRWPGLNLNDQPVRTSNQVEKMRIVEKILCQLTSKYGFDVELDTVHKSLSHGYSVFSIAEILKS